MALKLNISICILALLLLFPSFFIFNAQDSQSFPPTYVYHTIAFHDYGFVMINDTVIFDTPQSRTNFLIGYPTIIRNNLDSVVAYDSTGELLYTNVVTFDEWCDIFWVNITFPSGKFLSDFTVITIFSGLIDCVGELNYTLTIPPYPILTIPTTSFNSSILLPQDALVANETYIDGVFFEWNNSTNTLTNSTTSPEPYVVKIGSFNFSGTISFLICQEARYKIDIDPMGVIHAYDTYYIKNLGGITVYSLDFKLPSGVFDIHVNDAAGEYSASKIAVNFRESDTILTLTLSYPIRGAPFKESYGFTIKYSMPIGQYLKHLGLWENQLTLPLFSRLNCTINNLTFIVNLPEGANFGATYPIGNISTSFLSQSFSYVFDKITPFNEVGTKIIYNYPIIWAAFRPTLWIGSIAGILCAVFSLQKRTRPTIPKIKVPSELLNTFIGACDRRMSLRQDLSQLSYDLLRGKIGRRDFNRKRRMFLQGLATLDKDFMNLKDKVKKLGSFYADAVRRLEIAEIELDSAFSSLSRIELEFKAGKISRDTYEKLRDEYTRKINRTITTINGILLSLREE